MRCKTCEQDYPSKYYFVSESLCTKCFEALSTAEKKVVVDSLESLDKESAARRNVDGHPLQCPVCGCEEFWKRRTLMTTPGATFFGMAWANRQAQNFICDSCGFVMWFFREQWSELENETHRAHDALQGVAG